jgi:hypothetical protein
MSEASFICRKCFGFVLTFRVSYWVGNQLIIKSISEILKENHRGVSSTWNSSGLSLNMGSLFTKPHPNQICQAYGLMSGSLPVAHAWNCAVEKGCNSCPPMPDLSVTRHIKVMLSLRSLFQDSLLLPERYTHLHSLSLVLSQVHCVASSFEVSPFMLLGVASLLMTAASCHLRVLGLLLKPCGIGLMRPSVTSLMSPSVMSLMATLVLFSLYQEALQLNFMVENLVRSRDQFGMASMKMVLWEPRSTQP